MFLVEESELSGVWGKKLFESDERKKKDERSVPSFSSPMLLILLAEKYGGQCQKYSKLDSCPRRNDRDKKLSLDQYWHNYRSTTSEKIAVLGQFTPESLNE